MSLILTEASSSQDVNNIRRAYKVALDAARRLKNASNNDVFATQQKQVRQKLRDNVRRCLLAAPEEYGPLKLEDTAWKYGVHIVVQKIKRENRGSKSPITQNNVRTFLESSFGWYMSFMFQLLDKLSETGGAENIYFDWWSQNEDVDVESNDEIGDKNKMQQILLNLCYKCLLYLGDLCRYQNDLFPAVYSIKLSYRYYMQAWHMFPTCGMPWNQIGSLVSSNYHGVLSLYFYRRCLQCETPYSDCYQNLKKLHDRAKKAYISYPRAQMDNLSLTASIGERKQAVYWFSVVFAHLAGLLRPATYCTERELNTACRRMLDLLDLCLYFNAEDITEDSDGDEHDQTPGFIKRTSVKVDGPSQLSNSFLVVVFGALVQSFDDLRKQKSNRVKAANALFIAAADHLVNHAILQLKDLHRYDSDESDDQSSTHSEVNETEENAIQEMPKQRNASPPKRSSTMGFMRRRRALLDDDLSEGESDLSEVSEEDEDRINDEIMYDIESDSASLFSQEMDSDEETEIKARQTSFRNTNNNTNHPKDSPATIIEEEESEEVAKKETRKLACSFLSTVNKADVIDEDGEGADYDDDRENQELVFEFEKSDQDDPDHKDSDQEDTRKHSNGMDDEKINLEEVVNVFENFTILHPIKIICDWLFVNDEIIMENISSPFWSRLVHLCNLLDIEQMIRIKGEISEEATYLLKENQWMQCFSLWEDRFLYGIPIMTDCHDHVDFKANPALTRWEENLLRLGLLRKFLRNISEKHPDTEISIVGNAFAARDIETLKDDEFNIRGTFEDENRTQNGELSEIIVVPTPEALANNLAEMKLIVADAKLKTIVTNITIDGLDQMKKESREARDATRWLDTVFSRCIGNVQSMQQTEQRSIQRLRRSDHAAWILQHLVNIGTKLQRQKKQVILLVDSVDRQTSPSVRKALTSASANNLMIQTVEDFVRLHDYKN